MIKKINLNISGKFIVFLGTDGSGKSYIINKIKKKRCNPFIKSYSFHFRYYSHSFQKDKQNNKLDNNPHNKKTYISLVSFFKIFYLSIEYIYGYFFIARSLKKNGSLIIFDRYFHDMLIDRRRYRLNCNYLIIYFFSLLIPKPDYFIILNPPLKIIRSRKKELTYNETTRQMQEYIKFANKNKNTLIIDSSRPINVIMKKIFSFITK